MVLVALAAEAGVAVVLAVDVGFHAEVQVVVAALPVGHGLKDQSSVSVRSVRRERVSARLVRNLANALHVSLEHALRAVSLVRGHPALRLVERPLVLLSASVLHAQRERVSGLREPRLASAGREGSGVNVGRDQSSATGGHDRHLEIEHRAASLDPAHHAGRRASGVVSLAASRDLLLLAGRGRAPILV